MVIQNNVGAIPLLKHQGMKEFIASTHWFVPAF